MRDSTAGTDEIHLVVAERQDQVTGVFWTRRPKQLLASLGGATYVGRVQIFASRHAGAVLKGLERRFEHSIETRAFECFWTLADFEEVLHALAEYDLDTGRLKERAGIRANDKVYVAKLGRGRVTGFTRCGRLVVEIERPGANFAKLTAFAPRSQVKPIVSLA